MNHILINATHSEEIRVAIVKNKKLTSLNIETSLNQKNKGNIYKGRISRVEQSLEAAFVDYGKFTVINKGIKPCNETFFHT
jgi:ribonuclease E